MKTVLITGATSKGARYRNKIGQGLLVKGEAESILGTMRYSVVGYVARWIRASDTIVIGG
ncbi:hypothetical protein P4V86_03740 [Brevibacillus laterosporus]|uniref:hypothetical protein n=1 Tax=Brevibacillus laterosporus TaxID=1465 RepID=UPI000373815D|nr:hypothetical protein [Brevibacillus laterosporus]ATO48628.1 hypothetical protein BrL25_05550 [Brevibacillus laterosporus DSM 25]MED2002471.1 hypothetical protein [Brevibacillus laterosporus]